MDGTLTLRGRVGTDLLTLRTKDGTLGVRFRLAVTQRRRTDAGSYEALGTRWYSIRAWGRLAHYTLACVHKGDPIIMVGRPHAQAWTNSDGEVMSDLGITAHIIGHDLNYGTATFYKNGGKAPELEHGLADSTNSQTGPVAQETSSQVVISTQTTPENSEYRSDYQSQQHALETGESQVSNSSDAESLGAFNERYETFEDVASTDSEQEVAMSA